MQFQNVKAGKNHFILHEANNCPWHIFSDKKVAPEEHTKGPHFYESMDADKKKEFNSHIIKEVQKNAISNISNQNINPKIKKKQKINILDDLNTDGNPYEDVRIFNEVKIKYCNDFRIRE